MKESKKIRSAASATSLGKRLAKRVPGIRSAQDLAPMRHSGIVNSLALFAPNSAGRPSQRSGLAMNSATDAFPSIVRYQDDYSRHRIPQTESASFSISDSTVDSSELAGLFNRYRSDKSTDHDYHLVYGPIISDLGPVAAILEVGLGTNNEDVVSNMSSAGMPGASLRAFRDYLPNAHIYGADVDRRVLFSDDRISTFFVDQTRPSTIADLANKLPELDLVIDDGLHSPDANMNILWLARRKLRRGGWVVIEDIAVAAVPFWIVVSHLVSADFESEIVHARNGVMWVAKLRQL